MNVSQAPPPNWADHSRESGRVTTPILGVEPAQARRLWPRIASAGSANVLTALEPTVIKTTER
jgi:hypothetical protein